MIVMRPSLLEKKVVRQNELLSTSLLIISRSKLLKYFEQIKENTRNFLRSFLFGRDDNFFILIRKLPFRV